MASDPISQGNNAADREAKQTSLRSPAQQLTVIPNLKSLGRKAMTNLDSILESRDISLLTKAHRVNAMVFPVVMYGCKSWILTECRRIGAFEP